MKRKQKLKVDKILVIFIIVGIVLFGFLGFKAYNDFFVDKTPNKKLMSLDLYGYTLAKNDTSLYKDNFKELEAVLNEKPINYHSYAKLLAKLFVIDVYTLDNKLASTDIGGLEFIHKDLEENFKENLGGTMYNFIESNIDGKRKQNLPVVKSIETEEVFETKYIFKDKEYPAYLVDLTWEYEKDLGYQKKIKLTIINDNNFLYVVKGE
ncbi:MAG: hypothetical protein IJ966_07290 [Bacilli bacterium]|nr:hypothetical protein [Bacilli bacterium]